VDAYITRLDTNCSDISARVNPPPAQINGELTWNQHWLRTARSTTRNIKFQKAVRRFSRSFALRPARGGRMFGGSWPSATYSSCHDFIRTTVAEPLHWLALWIRWLSQVHKTKKAILSQSNVGKTKGEIRSNFNSYCVMIGRKTPQPIRRKARWRHSATKVNGAHAPNPIPRNNARCWSRICNSSYRAQVPLNCGRHDQSPDRMRRAASCQCSSNYECLDMSAAGLT